MKVSCPTCGRGTAIDPDIGDFPTRCQRCGGLLRRHPSSPETPAPAAAGDPLLRALPMRRQEPAPSVVSCTRIQRGALAGLLISNSASQSTSPAEEPPAVISCRKAPAPLASADPDSILRPESRREIARCFARQRALRRAQLYGRHQALGALSWFGVVFSGLLMLSALVIKAEAMWCHPVPPSADTIQLSQR